MRRLILGLFGLAVLGFAAFYLITAPKPVDASQFTGLTPVAMRLRVPRAMRRWY